MSDTTADLDLDPEDLGHEEAEDQGQQGNQPGAEDQEDDVDAGQDPSVGAQAGQEGQRPGLGQQPARRPNDTIRTQREARQAADRRAIEAEARVTALQQQIAQFQQRPDPVAQARAAQEENERLAMMQPQEQVNYLFQKQAQQNYAMMQSVQRQTADTLDKVKFDGLAASNPVAARFADRVEELVAEQSRQGFSVQREQALKFAIGEAVLAKAPAAAKRQRAAAATRVAGQTVTRGSAGGDVPSDRSRGGGNTIADLENRLRGQQI